MTLARLIGRRIAREGWKIAGAYKDSAVPGDGMISVPASRRCWRTRGTPAALPYFRPSRPRPGNLSAKG